MTKLYKETQTIPSVAFGELSTLPPVSFEIGKKNFGNDFLLDEDDGLFINYGRVESIFPYRYQDGYDRKLLPTDYVTIVLENEFLKATFMPCFGGKLWSLFDKKNNKELLFKNSVVRPGNLSTRKAWLSGGIEWNASLIGHGPYTCAPIHTARTELDDGTPVLRFYYFERIRKAVVQMDFFLPKASKLLYARMRLVNPNAEVIPMYWWSNIAVEEKEGNRVIVPAKEAYTEYNKNAIKIPVPEYNGIDFTYPTNNVTSIDYFWKTEKNARKYIFQSDKEGYGLYQTSTSRLKGRKLFVWGNTPGGRRWTNFLTADGENGRYNEIQCGLTYTQYECLPMPPHTVWEWLETYGALQVDTENIRGDWLKARKETEEKIDLEFSEIDLENLLLRTRSMAKRRAEEILYRGDGWGALELKEIGCGKGGLMCEHLDFGDTDEEQRAWENLLSFGSLGAYSPKNIPISYCSGENWRKRLEAALKEKDKENWYAWYQAGTLALAENRLEEAEQMLNTSYSLEPSVWTEYALAILYRKTENSDKELFYMLSAYEHRKHDVFLAREVFFTLYKEEKSVETKDLYEKAALEIRENKRCILYYAFALARLNKAEEAEKVLCDNAPLIPADLREGEISTVELWDCIRSHRGVTDTEPPEALDFRMFVKLDAWINGQK